MQKNDCKIVVVVVVVVVAAAVLLGSDQSDINMVMDNTEV